MLVKRKGAKQADDIDPPDDDEAYDDFMDRCVDQMTDDGDMDPDAAEDACQLMWDERRASSPEQRGSPAPPVPITPPAEGEAFADFMGRCTGAIAAAGAADWDAQRAQDYCSVLFEEHQIPGEPQGLRSRRRLAHVEHRTHSDAGSGAEFILSDETVDRMGDVISAGGWDLEAFKRNPVALFNHRSDFPIGTWRNLRVEGTALRGHLDIAPEGTSERIDEIRRLRAAGILRAVSVGFRPLEYKARRDDKGEYLGEHFLRQELVETSLVSVPANPNALEVAKRLKISPATLELVFAKPGRRDALATVRRSIAKPGARHSHRETRAMSGPMAKRIEESQKRLAALREQLTEHLGKINDDNVSDAELATTKELNAKIAQAEETHGSLVEAERRLMTTSANNLVPADQSGGGESALEVRNPRPFAMAAKKVEPVEYIWRSLTVAIKHHQEGHKRPILEVLKDTYGEDEKTRLIMNIVTRAASAPATIPTPGWAAELVTQTWTGFLEALLPFSVYPGIASRGTAFTFGRNGVINLPLRLSTPQIAGSFVGEGAPIPVRQGQFATAQLTPKKLGVISTFTRELSEHSTPAIEGIIREAIQNDTAIAVDSVLLDANPATAVRPPGLLNGVTGLTATTGGTILALIGDINQLIDALSVSTLGNIRNPVWLMSPSVMYKAALTPTAVEGQLPFREEISRGSLMSIPIIKSASVPAGYMILMDCADYATVTEAAPRFDVSDQAVLHMEDTTPAAIIGGTAGTPAPAVPTRSLWQTDTIGVRMILPMNWLMRRAGMVQFVTGMTW